MKLDLKTNNILVEYIKHWEEVKSSIITMVEDKENKSPYLIGKVIDLGPGSYSPKLENLFPISTVKKDDLILFQPQYPATFKQDGKIMYLINMADVVALVDE